MAVGAYENRTDPKEQAIFGWRLSNSTVIMGASIGEAPLFRGCFWIRMIHWINFGSLFQIGNLLLWKGRGEKVMLEELNSRFFSCKCS